MHMLEFVKVPNEIVRIAALWNGSINTLFGRRKRNKTQVLCCNICQRLFSIYIYMINKNSPCSFKLRDQFILSRFANNWAHIQGQVDNPRPQTLQGFPHAARNSPTEYPGWKYKYDTREFRSREFTPYLRGGPRMETSPGGIYWQTH